MTIFIMNPELYNIWYDHIFNPYLPSPLEFGWADRAYKASEQQTGLRYIVNANLSRVFEIIDEKKYLEFLLKYS